MYRLFNSNARLIYYISLIALGGAVQGIDSGIIATVLGQSAFVDYMYPAGTPNASSLVGAIVAVSSAGATVGALAAGMMLELFGRRMTLFIATFFTVVSSVMQAAANGAACMIVGRCISGIAIGIMTPTCPIYISELAKPQERGRFVAVFGVMIAIGFCLANWIGYACSFAEGNLTWRLSLTMQIPLAVVIMAFAFTLPESPRWLVQKERYDEFHQSMRRLYSDETDESNRRQMAEIQAQLQLEASQRTNRHVGHAIIELFSPRNRRRTLTAIVVYHIFAFSGAFVIQSYQTILYGSLGFTGKQALLVSGVYGIMGLVGQIINILFVSDRWPRVRTLYVGCIVLAGVISILMALSKYYASGSNVNGARAGIAFIFIQSALFAVFFNSTLFTVVTEYFPSHLRGYGTSVAVTCGGITLVWLAQVTPAAFDKITYRYYLVFICTMAALAAFCFFCVKETNQMTLESIAGQFGDEVVSVDKAVAAVEEMEMENVNEPAPAELRV